MRQEAVLTIAITLFSFTTAWALWEAPTSVSSGTNLGAVAGGVLGGLAKSPATVSGVLAGAASGAGLVAVVGLIGALFDAEAGHLTAGLGLGAAVLLGLGANLTSNTPALPAASTTSA